MTGIKRVLSIYFAKKGNLLARGIAYSMLITAIPFLLLSIYAASLIFQDTAALQGALNLWIHDLIPEASADMVIMRVSEILQDSRWKKVGATGLVLMFIAPQILFASIESALSVVMMPRKRHHFMIRQVLYILMHIFVVSLFFLFSIFSLWFNTALGSTQMPTVVYLFSSKVTSLLIVWLSLMAIYRMSIHRKINFGIVAKVSLVISLVWMFFNFFGSILITTSGRNELIFGILAGFILLMVWAYLFAALLLLGGIVISGKSDI